jgi:hypothetical protein
MLRIAAQLPVDIPAHRHLSSCVKITKNMLHLSAAGRPFAPCTPTLMRLSAALVVFLI